MSISLIGIIAVQLYWIDNAVESKKQQFRNDVQKSLGRVAERINEKEQDLIDRKIEGMIENIGLANAAQIKNYFFQEIDTTTKQTFSLGATYLEENFKLPSEEFLDNDSIILKRISGKKDFFQTKTFIGIDKKSNSEGIRSSFTKRYTNLEKEYNYETFRSLFEKKPIHQRVSNRELNATIKDELNKRNIFLDFKYGVYGVDGLATKLKSGYYTINKKNSYRYPLFFNTEDLPVHFLYVTFPTKNNHILSGISGILLLSLFFIFIIIIAFSSSLYQLIKQKKLS
ncbi:MAG: two-component sensor histidine kinase, partial [Polaribacter sp.]